jgi:gluconate 2-dehydrogenase gamma chain
MPDSRDGPDRDKPHELSRRDLLKRAAVAGAVVAAPGCASTGQVSTTPGPVRLETLSQSESDVLEAIVARLIPTDANGPGATEARAALYIDHALGDALASSRGAYAAGLAAVDAYAQTSKGARFANLAPAVQDAVLTEMEQNAATGFAPDSATFFNLVRTHTIEGTFCDPAYGGNADFVGWELVGYPGLRLAVGADQQQLDETAEPRYRSAYSFTQFTPARGTRGR